MNTKYIAHETPIQELKLPGDVLKELNKLGATDVHSVYLIQFKQLLYSKIILCNWELLWKEILTDHIFRLYSKGIG